MAIASFLLGLLSLLGVCVALVPFLNIANCIMLPLGLFGLLLGIADLYRRRDEEGGKGLAIAGVVLSGLALLVGGIRVIISLMTTGGIV